MFTTENGAEYTQYECVPPRAPPSTRRSEIPTSAPNRWGTLVISASSDALSRSALAPPPRVYAHHPLSFNLDSDSSSPDPARLARRDMGNGSSPAPVARLWRRFASACTRT